MAEEPDPRDYDKEFTAPEGGPVRRRLGIDTDRGEITRFVVQLEYLVPPTTEEWRIVVRYDHDSEGSDVATHDVTKEGLHMDVYRDRKKIDTVELTPPLPASDALEKAEDHLSENLEDHIRRFEQWHGIQ